MQTKDLHLHAERHDAGPAGAAEAQVTAFIADRMFPCVGAKSALNKGRLHTQAFGPLADPAHTERLRQALREYSARYPDPGSVPATFVATFAEQAMDESTFERRMWRQLQVLHDCDMARGGAWAADVSDDPARQDFSFSVDGRAFFVVGMHAGASRLARRTPMPCLVFNFHEQFEHLKATGKYAVMQEAIRARDRALQGEINPVLARFGESSEARQYSGRAIEADWKCPFHSKAHEHA